MQVNPINFDYANSSIIKPPFEPLKNINDTKHKITRVVIDSRDRNTAIFPTPSQYEVELQDDIEEVTAIELCIAQIPMMAYNVSSNNNTLVINNVQYVIPVGEYNASTLATTITLELADVRIRVLYNNIRDKFSLHGQDAFTLNASGSINKTLGFISKKDYVSTSIPVSGETYTGYDNLLDAPFRVNFQDNKYLVLHIDQVSVNNSINSVLHKSFAILSQEPYKYSYNDAQCSIKKYLNPPIARMQKVRLSFRDYYGNLYDFQNHDHRIELVFESRKHLSKYMA